MGFRSGEWVIYGGILEYEKGRRSFSALNHLIELILPFRGLGGLPFHHPFGDGTLFGGHSHEIDTGGTGGKVDIGLVITHKVLL